MSSMHELINTLRLILKEEQVILASPEDAAYFRSLAVKSNKESLPPAPQPVSEHEEKKIKSLTSGSKNQSFKEEENGRLPTVELAANSQNLTEREITPKPKEELKNQKWDKEASQLFTPEPAAVFENTAKREEEKYETKPTIAKTDFPITTSLSSIRALVGKIAPELAILDDIPSDAIARKIATRWKTKNRSAPISILSGGELPQHKILLEEIAAALDIFFGPAKIVQAEAIEKENQWESFLSVEDLKLILICDSTLWQLHSLRKFYKETPTLGTRMLGKTPLFLLPDLSLYLKDPHLKRSLWKALCQKCS